MTTELGVNENHHAQVINYMRFARYQRGQRLRAVDICFDELKDSRLSEDTTFTVDEVMDMLDGLLTVVRGEVESELINTAHTNVLLMRQMFRQAEKWHLKLQADISELENRELLEKIKDFEEKQFAGTKRDTDISALKTPKLTPLNEGGGAALLHMKIDELNEENEQMRAKLMQVQGSLSSAERKRLQLEGDLFSARSAHTGMDSSEDVNDLRKKMSGLESQLDKSQKMSVMNAQQLEGDLTSTKHELLRIQEMLEMAEKELEKKLHQTAPFKNLKQMLQQKNERMKEYRRRLSKYESVNDD